MNPLRPPRPRIGITSGTAVDWNPDGYLWRPLGDSIEDAGGEAVWIGPGCFNSDSPAAYDALLETLDGLLLPGGADVVPQPGIYDPSVAAGGNLSPAQESELHVESEPNRDAYELPLARRAVELDMPIFGICRGFQVLNVVCGGQLIPDIRTGLRHRAYSHELSEAHLITTISGTRIASLMGSGFTPINSRHHQGVTVDLVAPGLQATAFAPDGIVEVLEDPLRPWRFAVQWHPERTQESLFHERDRRLFRSFVEECRR